MKNKISIEEALVELEELSYKIESEDTTLDEGIKICERSKELIKFCEEEISKAQQKITELELD